jgi:hypothetical protein
VFHGAKKTKAGEKTGFDHIPRIVYAIFWRTVSSSALSPFARDVFGAFGIVWSPDSFFEYWPPRSMLLMSFAFIVVGYESLLPRMLASRTTRQKAAALAN